MHSNLRISTSFFLSLHIVIYFPSSSYSFNIPSFLLFFYIFISYTSLFLQHTLASFTFLIYYHGVIFACSYRPVLVTLFLLTFFPLITHHFFFNILVSFTFLSIIMESYSLDLFVLFLKHYLILKFYLFFSSASPFLDQFLRVFSPF